MFGRRGAVAAEHYSATLAGIEILRQGGNAVDAACAATLVEGVVNPQMHTIGGELPILISAPGRRRWSASTATWRRRARPRHRPSAICGHDADSRRRRPGRRRAGRIGRHRGSAVRVSAACASKTCAARPSNWREIGFPGPFRPDPPAQVGHRGQFREIPHGRAPPPIYLPEGRIPREGELLRNPALADMYRASGQGRKSNAPATARRACAPSSTPSTAATSLRRSCVSSRQKGGLLERSDFDRFEIPVESSVHIQYGGAEIHKCGPWNQGPALLQSLTILKNFDLRPSGAQFGRVHSSCAGSHEAGLCRPRAVLRRSPTGGCAAGRRCFRTDMAPCAPG